MDIITKCEDPVPWDRRPGESAKAYRAFSMYRDLGPMRSWSAVLHMCSKSAAAYRTQIRRWSVRHHWVLRARAFDEYIDQALKLESIERIKAYRRCVGDEALNIRETYFKALMAEDPESIEPAEKRKRWVSANTQFAKFFNLDASVDGEGPAELVVRVEYPLGVKRAEEDDNKHEP